MLALAQKASPMLLALLLPHPIRDASRAPPCLQRNPTTIIVVVSDIKRSSPLKHPRLPPLPPKHHGIGSGRRPEVHPHSLPNPLASSVPKDGRSTPPFVPSNVEWDMCQGVTPGKAPPPRGGGGGVVRRARVSTHQHTQQVSCLAVVD
jgi:hypothetical protein